MTFPVVIGLIVAFWLAGIGFMWSLLAIGAKSDELRLPPIDDSYLVEGEDDFGTPWSVPTRPGPASHLPDSSLESGAGPGTPRGGHRAV